MAKRTKSAKGTKSGSAGATPRTASYKHPEATTLLRPDVGTQPQFRKKKPPAEYSGSVWQHLAGTTSTPFQIGENGQIAVKVIDDRGNELLVVKNAKEAE